LITEQTYPKEVGGKGGWIVKMTIHFHLLLMVRMCRALLPLPPHAFITCHLSTGIVYHYWNKQHILVNVSVRTLYVHYE